MADAGEIPKEVPMPIRKYWCEIQIRGSHWGRLISVTTPIRKGDLPYFGDVINLPEPDRTFVGR